MKKLFVLLAAGLAALALVVPVQAAVNNGVHIEYDGFGRVELDFRRDAHYKDVQITVEDADGRAYEAVLADMDDDELDFVVKDIIPGSYRFALSGVRFSRTGEYKILTGEFKVPEKDEVVIKSVDYDADDRELEIEFNARVQLVQPQVTLLDADGREYEAKIREWDEDGVEFRVEKLVRGAEYTVTVHGIQLPGFDNTVSAAAVFTAR